ncbi:transposase family protein [Streptomyces virginiae]
MHHRTHRTVRRLAPLFGISPATVCRVVKRLRPPLAAEPAPLPVAGVDRSWIVDGSYLGDISACRRCNRVRARPDRKRPGSRPTCRP